MVLWNHKDLKKNTDSSIAVFDAWVQLVYQKPVCTFYGKVIGHLATKHGFLATNSCGLFVKEKMSKLYGLFKK